MSNIAACWYFAGKSSSVSGRCVRKYVILSSRVTLFPVPVNKNNYLANRIYKLWIPIAYTTQLCKEDMCVQSTVFYFEHAHTLTRSHTSVFFTQFCGLGNLNSHAGVWTIWNPMIYQWAHLEKSISDWHQIILYWWCWYGDRLTGYSVWARLFNENQ